ncbi:hypothetical protein E7T06_09445 [Deinococcus sp. Arct2-2]|uniref:hypothetical protein n=1 Tax=Deinococcus sp. Arct2-2 TaxID=2568653 RepID=UPI0010A37385|nr:hypothetical protein [Deinococcus sp. Arct2-2]THF69971.1 hypothetical protein E7T06_09445 [Deinococcus sp. Arct2-2]
MTRAAQVEIGTRLRYAGREWKVVAQPAHDLRLRDDEGVEITAVWASVLQAHDYAVVGLEEPPLDRYQAMFDMLPREVQEKAQKLARHVLEVLHGTSERGGPIHPDYDPALFSQNARVRRKVAELRAEDPASKVSERQIHRWIAAYQHNNRGVFGLVDRRHLRIANPHSASDHLIMRAIDKVQDDLEGRSDVTLDELRRLTTQKLRAQNQLAGDEGEGPGKVRPPARTKFAELVRATAPTLFKTARQRDSIRSNLKKRPFGRARADRPGQIVLLDYTRLDLSAISEVDGTELRLSLLIALDLWSRAIVSWDLVEAEPAGRDATGLVIGILFPKVWHPDWPSASRWPYTGVPEEIVIEAFGLDADLHLAASPPLLVELLVVDGGKIFIGSYLEALADDYTFDFRFARPLKGSDKSHVETLFGTLRERFAESLWGYVGPNVQKRGKDVRGYHTRTELMSLIGAVITSEYNERSHDACFDPLRPKLKLSPNQMLELGLKMQGFLTVPRSRNAYYLSLRREKRRIGENGVTIQYRRYDGPELNPYRQAASPYPELEGKWPFLIDPRDPSYIFFQDPYPADGAEPVYHALPWVDIDHPSRPFQDLLYESASASFRQHGFNNHQAIDNRRDERRNLYDTRLAQERRQARAEALEVLLKLNRKPEGGKLGRTERNEQSRQQAAQRERAAALGVEAPPPLERPAPLEAAEPLTRAVVIPHSRGQQTLDRDDRAGLYDDLKDLLNAAAAEEDEP